MTDETRGVAPLLPCAALLTLLLCGCAPPPATPENARRVTVHGAATIPVTPNRVSFSAGVETIAATPSAAFRANSAKVQRLIAALKERGVEDEQMQTSYLDMSSLSVRGRVQATFRVSNRVTVTRDDPGTVGDLIEAAVAAGANDVGGVQFFVGERSAFEKRGLDLAFEDARSKAEALARKAGMSVGPVVSLTDQAFFGAGDGDLTRLASLGYAANQSFQVGTDEMRSVVTVVFELR
jgi:uncharacterized protein YggE